MKWLSGLCHTFLPLWDFLRQAHQPRTSTLHQLLSSLLWINSWQETKAGGWLRLIVWRDAGRRGGEPQLYGESTHWLGSREQGRLAPPDLLPFPFYSVLTTVWGIVLPTLILGHPPSVKSLWKHSYRCFQKYVTLVIPNPPNLAKLALKVNLHTLKLYAKINSPPFRGLG